MNSAQTGIRVFKQGVEGYTLGDYSSSVTAGNLRECNYEELKKRYEPEYDRIAQELEYYCFRHAKKKILIRRNEKIF